MQHFNQQFYLSMSSLQWYHMVTFFSIIVKFILFLFFLFQNTSEIVLTALALATFPILYFFTFLYYTDPAAIFFALLTYHLVLSANHKSAAAVGVAAIICRQTNIMWVVFGAGLTTGRILIQWINLDKKQDTREEKRLSDWLVLSKTFSLMGQSLRHNPKVLVNLAVDVCKAVWCYVLVGMAFIIFVIINEGVVVGDRSNHQPCLNFPQLFYFLFITTFFSFMHMISVEKIRNFLRYTLTNPFKTILFFLIAVLFISKFMFIHEYNLADNRHYNFYFLSKIIRRNEFSKFILIPAYYYTFVTFWNLLQKKDVFWKLSYLICVSATVIPQRMVEFRYFIMPYLIFRLNMKMPSKQILLMEVLFYFAVNAWTVYMYIFRPFPWTNADSLQRFMW